MSVDPDRLQKIAATLADHEGLYVVAHRTLRATADRMGVLRGEIIRVTSETRPPGPDPVPGMRAELQKLTDELPSLQSRERALAEAVDNARRLLDACEQHLRRTGRPVPTLGVDTSW